MSTLPTATSSASLRAFARRACAACLLALASFPGPAASAVPDGIHWNLRDETSVTLSWRGTSNSLRYGPTAAYGTTVGATAAQPPPISSPGPYWEATLTGLAVNTLYHYSIDGGLDHTFRTPPPKGASGFTVYAEGDVGSSLAYWRVPVIQAQIAADLPRFVLMLGDLTYANNHGQQAADQHFNDVMPWSQDAAYMPIWGNHEWDPGDSPTNYKGRFDLPNPRSSPGSPSPGGEDWYWFDYGNVRFIGYPEPWTGAWSDWRPRAEAVMDSAQSDPNIDFIVTFGHRPAYSSGNHSGESTLRTHLNALGTTHSKYVLNLNGHSHDYERSHPQSGVVHVTVGSGGAHLQSEEGPCIWEGGCPPPSWSAFRAMHHATLRLRFTETGIEGDAICGPPGGDASNENDIVCVQGTVMDHFEIGSPGSGPNLVGNPSFESGVTGWRDYHGSIVAQALGAHDGLFSLHVTGPLALTEDFGTNDSPNWITSVAGPGLRHRFQAWVRSATSAGHVRLQVREYKYGLLQGPFTLSAPVTLTPQWQLATVDYVTVTDSSTLDFQIIDQPLAGGESFDVDDVSIRLVPEVPLSAPDLPSTAVQHPRFAPNPTPGSGRLSFDLARAGWAKVEILDLQGRRLRRLAHERALPAGEHTFEFDGRRDGGERLGPGVYFARVLSAEGGAVVRVLVLP